MTSEEMLVNVLLLPVILGVLWLAFRALDSMRIEEFRQDIFELRRELFLLMADGAIGPEDVGYTYLRTTMNGTLRLAHRITFLRLVMIWVACWSAAKPGGMATAYRTNWLARLEQLDETTRDKLRSLDERVNLALVTHLLRMSTPLTILAYFVLALIALRRIPKLVRAGIHDLVKKPIQRILKRRVRQRLSGPIGSLRAQAEIEGHWGHVDGLTPMPAPASA